MLIVDDHEHAEDDVVDETMKHGTKLNCEL